jgi:hypothetical protein
MLQYDEDDFETTDIQNDINNQKRQREINNRKSSDPFSSEIEE